MIQILALLFLGGIIVFLILHSHTPHTNSGNTTKDTVTSNSPHSDIIDSFDSDSEEFKEKSVHIDIDREGITSVENTSPEVKIDYFAVSEYPATIYPISTGSVSIEQTNRTDKGVMEDYFYDFLSEQFGEQIKNNLSIRIGDRKIVPDFVLLSEDDNKPNIVIEVDEPYSFDSGNQLIPVHFLGQDDDRNTLLIQNGFIVVRFAEEQVVKFPKECCSFIQSAVWPLPVTKCWTYEIAQQMITDKYRDSYLPIPFTGQLKTNHSISFRSFKIRFIDKQIAKNGKLYYVVLVKNGSTHPSQPTNYEIWVEPPIFLKIIATAPGIDVLTPKTESYPSLLWHNSRIEGIGSTNGKYFNFLADSTIKLIPSDSLISAKKHLEEMFKYWNHTKPYKS